MTVLPWVGSAVDSVAAVVPVMVAVAASGVSVGDCPVAVIVVCADEVTAGVSVNDVAGRGV